MSPPTWQGVAFVCQLFHAHVNHWRRLRVNFSECRKLLHSLSSPVVLLPERIQVCWDGDDTPAHGPEPSSHDLAYTILTGGRKRRSALKMRGLGLQCCLPPLATLTTLELHFPYWHQSIRFASLASMLNGMTTLTKLVICGDPCYYFWSITSIELPSLQSLLHLCATKEFDLTPVILNAISAPLLYTILLEQGSLIYITADTL
jgi:hypothetical protein